MVFHPDAIILSDLLGLNYITVNYELLYQVHSLLLFLTFISDKFNLIFLFKLKI